MNTIKGWDFSKIEIEETINSNKILLNPSIDFTNSCNLNCDYCFIEDKNSKRKKRKINELSLEESLSVIDSFISLNARTINIVGAGEPTLDRHFYEIIDYIYKNGLTTVLFTNGLKFLTDEKMVPFLFSRDVSIILKYNSDKDEIQDLIVGKKGYRVKRNEILQLLIERGFNCPQTTRLGLNTIVFKGNYKELPKIHKWCRENNIFPLSANFIPTGRTENGFIDNIKQHQRQSEDNVNLLRDYLMPFSQNDSIWLYNKNREIDKSFNINWDDKIAYYNGGSCTQILGLYVDILGNIWPCVARSKRIRNKNINGLLGNIRNGTSIEDIWKNHFYMNIVRKRYNGGCPYKNLKLNKKLLSKV